MREESLLSDYLVDCGCTCHCGNPPCSFCTSLNEEELDIYINSGIPDLRAYLETPTIEDFDIW
jgi:hypothetical protein